MINIVQSRVDKKAIKWVGAAECAFSVWGA